MDDLSNNKRVKSVVMYNFILHVFLAHTITKMSKGVENDTKDSVQEEYNDNKIKRHFKCSSPSTWLEQCIRLQYVTNATTRPDTIACCVMNIHIICG